MTETEAFELLTKHYVTQDMRIGMPFDDVERILDPSGAMTIEHANDVLRKLESRGWVTQVEIAPTFAMNEAGVQRALGAHGGEVRARQTLRSALRRAKTSSGLDDQRFREEMTRAGVPVALVAHLVGDEWRSVSSLR